MKDWETGTNSLTKDNSMNKTLDMTIQPWRNSVGKMMESDHGLARHQQGNYWNMGKYSILIDNVPNVNQYYYAILYFLILTVLSKCKMCILWNWVQMKNVSGLNELKFYYLVS